jgi:hypothetical protein
MLREEGRGLYLVDWFGGRDVTKRGGGTGGRMRGGERARDDV